MTVKIYKPAKTAMQSGSAGTHEWVLDQGSTAPVSVDPLMGWSGQGSTSNQISLTFPTKDAAVAYAEHMGLAYTVEESQPRRRVKKSYAENFKFGRIGTWTH
jgi:hypothetical protein